MSARGKIEKVEKERRGIKRDKNDRKG